MNFGKERGCLAGAEIEVPAVVDVTLLAWYEIARLRLPLRPAAPHSHTDTRTAEGTAQRLRGHGPQSCVRVAAALRTRLAQHRETTFVTSVICHQPLSLARYLEW